MERNLFIPLFLLPLFGAAQSIGVNYDGSAPTAFFDVKTNNAADGININNAAANGDPLLSYELNGTRIITMGLDDSDADKFKIGTAALTTATRLTLMTNGRFGINTTAPGSLWHMTNGTTTVGANSMADFENTGASGVALSGDNTSATSGYNAIEGVSRFGGTTFSPAGVYGLHIFTNATINSPGIGVHGFTNEWQGNGVEGARFNSGGPNTGFGGLFINDLGYTGGFFLVSDGRLKKNVQPIDNATEKLRQLRPVSYDYKVEDYPLMGLNTEHEFGFIAQEVQQVLPMLVREKNLPADGARMRSANEEPNEAPRQDVFMMDYTRLIPLLVQALQEQQDRIEVLEGQLNAAKTTPDHEQH